MKIMRIIAHLLHNRGREPLVLTISLRKNINSPEHLLIIINKVNIPENQTLQLKCLSPKPKRAVQFTGQRCGETSERPFRIFAKITQISRQFKMEAKSISPLVQMVGEAFRYHSTPKTRQFHHRRETIWASFSQI